ncbi:tRNA (N6-isopentenyl adenosine(37)-C2)-methylthiotransferase MiaB [Megasphaera butyrica]|uniref:tRNA (N6-isopentenyl adenosine(37)-C2)-methylthiotransferase MiaB n=2 Tax=Megasphaera TaxID=906 RepID=UPI000822866D|nr:tRNA (N6-isopentenyl adenosine(37)-C2)-methylthiotransferase MiaB [Megasphaera butyrica]MCU6715119.1 tRNA (N6-isopentenyl adenosine(37)-C2)-methylthiotransferase MiaB [Megasphaera butyrica]SCH94175.1 (Dimethylallyl)adenosine tRNA methylthiotransferase MiaB [uncultured Megasphaera sp.]SCJ41467.1 (Dimethylallyl)adenosine tRNA methylthiotransferase MiaB [uncultured Ruminococcus sp.]
MDIIENKFYFLLTYGCQMNESDSERYAGQLESLGYRRTEDMDMADVVLLNTCCVRETAEGKILGKIGELKHVKQHNPNLIIAVAGCMAQEWQDRLFERAPHIDLVIGTHNIHKLVELIRERQAKSGHYLEADMTVPAFHDLPTKRFQKFFAWVPIMNGCNKFCTYCIVPYVRGREVSRPIADIVREIEEIAKEGYKEITLLGQNVNSYGLDLKDGTDFSALLQAVDRIDGIERVRYMTSHPKDMTFAMIDAIADSRKVVNHMHLPIQSGSDELLKKMNRGYTVDQYMELVEYARKRIPDLVLTTDIIVGFPGETEEMFCQTLDLLKRVQYDMAYTFIYSPRTGTPAAKMDHQIPQEEKSRRLQRLMDVQNVYSLQLNQAMEHKEYEVIVEGPTKNDENHWFGRTTGNKMIIWEHDGSAAIGDTVKVAVDKGQTWVLKGHLIH